MRAAAFLALGVLAACASDRSYVEPTGDVARLANKSVRDGSISDWELYEVRLIDGMRTWSAFVAPAYATHAVAPGAHRIVVRFAYAPHSRHWQVSRVEPLEAYFILDAEFEPGHDYQVNGTVREQFTAAWIEDKGTGQVVSARVACQPRNSSATTPPVCSKPSAIQPADGSAPAKKSR